MFVKYTLLDQYDFVTASGTTGDIHMMEIPEGGRLLEDVIGPPQSWWDGENFRPIPQSPDPVFTFDKIEKVWKDNRTLDQLKLAKLSELNAAFEDASGALTSGYPASERLTWPMQQSEALAWAADPTSPTPYLDGLAAARGIPAEDLRTKALGNVQAWMVASQTLIGRRQALRDMLDAADTRESVDAVQWSPTT